MAFRVVKLSRQFNSSYVGEFLVVDGIKDRESAMVLAEVATLEHSEAIGVQYQKSGLFGFEFTTNNGTLVKYKIAGRP